MQIDGSMPVTITLTVDQANVVLSGLGAQPYDRVAALILAIQQQAGSQIAAAQQAADAPVVQEVVKASND
jgi:hypothetical protein